MPTNEKLLENYSKRLGSKGNTRQIYLKIAKDFLDYANGNLDRENILKYLDHLRRKHKYGESSANFAFRVIRTLFGRNNIEWPFGRGEAPQISEDDIQAPALDPDIIIEMIQAMKKDVPPAERAFLAISTTYGTRRIEMAELTQSDINIKGKTIHISTAKHGRERTHLIPDIIAPYLKGYDFDTGMSQFSIFALWYRIEDSIDLGHTNRVGFHSVRRSLNTLLLRAGFNQIDVMGFLRWKHSTSSNMPFRYSAIKWVGREGVTTGVTPEYAELDNRIFAKHPFIKYWE